MNPSGPLSALALLAVASFGSSAEDLKCSHEQKFKDGSSRGAQATVRIEGGQPVSLRVESFNASGKEGGGYVCALDTSDPDSQSKWSKRGESTILEVNAKSFSRTSHLEVQRGPSGYKINLEEVWSGYCGFGAEWPRSIEIKKGTSRCTVTY